MTDPDAVIETSTAVNVTTPEDDETVITRPSKWVSNILWRDQ